MKLFGCIEIIWHPPTIRGRVKAIYKKEGHLAAYEEYRRLTGKGRRESHVVVRKWLIRWGFRDSVIEHWGSV